MDNELCDSLDDAITSLCFASEVATSEGAHGIAYVLDKMADAVLSMLADAEKVRGIDNC
jgi:hypothetical protein